MLSIFLKTIALKALIITIADDIFINYFLHFGYTKIDLNQMKLIEKKTFLLTVVTF